MLIKTQETTFLQICRNIILNYKVIAKNIINLDEKCKSNFLALIS